MYTGGLSQPVLRIGKNVLVAGRASLYVLCDGVGKDEPDHVPHRTQPKNLDNALYSCYL
jgi:hypothetical protein